MPQSFSLLLCHSGLKSHTKKDGKVTRKTESELSRCHTAVTAPQDTGSEESDSGTWEGGSWYLSVGLLSWQVPTCSGLSPFFSADGVQRLWRGERYYWTVRQIPGIHSLYPVSCPLPKFSFSSKALLRSPLRCVQEGEAVALTVELWFYIENTRLCPLDPRHSVLFSRRSWEKEVLSSEVL